MSRAVTMDLRERWAAKSAIVTRWLVQDSFEGGAEVCEIRVDGGDPRIVRASEFQTPDVGRVYWKYVAEGNEVGPWGMLMEHGVIPAGWGLPDRPNKLHVTARRKLVRREAYPRVFLSYRRDDADAYAGRVHETLTRSLGEEIFMDLFGIRGGEIFPWTIQQAVAHTVVMVVLVGPKWLTLTGPGSTRRIDNSLDFVRREVVAAMDRGIAIIPVLLPGATVPERQSLPDDMQGLEELQALTLSPRHWDTEVQELVTSVREHLQQAEHGQMM